MTFLGEGRSLAPPNMPLRISLALAALAAACLCVAGTAAAAPSSGTHATVCGYSGYSYAGFESPSTAFGVSAHLTALAAPEVVNGHVAAWVGVGGTGMGPHGEDEWVQVGYAGYPDGHSELYYEYATPGMAVPQYVSLGDVTPGESHDVGVHERLSQPGAWRVFVDGHAVSDPIVLPGSDGAWRPIATSETWDGGTRNCNRFSYGFNTLAIATKLTGGWQPFALSRPIEDPGYRVTPRISGFVAAVAA
jgi:hypothetical protein